MDVRTQLLLNNAILAWGECPAWEDRSYFMANNGNQSTLITTRVIMIATMIYTCDIPGAQIIRFPKG